MIQRISKIINFNPDERFDYAMIMTYPEGEGVEGDSMKHEWIKLGSLKSKEEEQTKEQNDTYNEFLRDPDYRKVI